MSKKYECEDDIDLSVVVKYNYSPPQPEFRSWDMPNGLPGEPASVDIDGIYIKLPARELAELAIKYKLYEKTKQELEKIGCIEVDIGNAIEEHEFDRIEEDMLEDGADSYQEEQNRYDDSDE